MEPARQDDDTGALRSRIAALEAAGKYFEAIPLAERYAEAIKARHGADHPSYAAALTDLAVLLLHKANRLAEAESLLRRALAIYERNLGANQVDIARTLNSLAQLLNDTGRVAEAEHMRRFVRAMEAGEARILGAGPPDTDAERDDAPAALEIKEPTPVEVEEAKAAAKPVAPGPLRRGASSRPAGEAPALAQAADAQRDRGIVLATTAGFERTRRPAAKEALEIDAGRLAYQIPKRMWVGAQETVEVRLGRREAKGLAQGFAGRGEIRAEDIPIVETMSVSLLCEPGRFDIVTRSEKDQLVKPDLVLGTPFHSSDFGRWVWLVTPREKGEHTLLVKVSAAVRDSRGLPTTASLPDKEFAVNVRVQLVRAAAGALMRAAPGLAWAVITALVGVFTKDYWWPAIRSMIGMG